MNKPPWVGVLDIKHIVCLNDAVVVCQVQKRHLCYKVLIVG